MLKRLWASRSHSNPSFRAYNYTPPPPPFSPSCFPLPKKEKYYPLGEIKSARNGKWQKFNLQKVLLTD
jgi:hypothetical protein